MLHAKGRVRLSGDINSWLARAIRGTQEAPLTHEIAQAAVQIPLHRDPADRFLAATAQILGMTLVTADDKLLGLGTIQTLANRRVEFAVKIKTERSSYDCRLGVFFHAA
jgi:PIN domain nuclease of toxin-antitoxin system